MKRPSEDDPFLRAQADLMAGVAGVFFVLMAVFLAIVAARNREDKMKLAAYQHVDKSEQEATAAVAQALKAIQDELDKINPGGAAIIGNELVINLDPGDTLLKFKSGDDELPCDTRDAALQKLQEVLKKTCSFITGSKVRLIYRIVLEGHTDNKAVTKDLVLANQCGTAPHAAKPSKEPRVRAFGGNVALSSRRAVNVLRLLVEDADPGTDKLRDCVDKYFLVSGRGPVDPLDVGADAPPGVALDAGADASPGVAWWLAAQSDAAASKNRRVILRVIGRQDIKRLAVELNPSPSTDGGPAAP